MMVKVVAAKPEDLSWTPRTHMMEEESQILQVVLWQTWSLIPTLRLRQEKCHEFEISIGDLLKLCLRKKERRKKEGK